MTRSSEATLAHGPSKRLGAQIIGSKLSRTYVSPGGLPIAALREVDIRIEPGSVTAIVGPSGSGKSTLLHLMGGMDRPDSGSLESDGVELSSLSAEGLTHYRRSVGFVFQAFALLPALTARDNVMLPVIPYRQKTSPSDRADALLADVGLRGRERALPSQLSGGQRQRVAVARALMNDPRLLVADEPTGNLDSRTGREVMDLLFSLRSTRGVTVVIATHDLDVAARCDHVRRIFDGRISASTNEPADGPQTELQ